jgi:hypothetical protein
MKLKALVCFVACAAMACAAQPAKDHNTGNSSEHNTATTSNNATASSASNTAEVKRSREAVRALTLTDQARHAIVSHNVATAKKDVTQALAALDEIDRSHVSATSVQNGQVPIFAEFETTSFLQPVMTAQHKTPPESANLNANNNSTQKNSTEVAKNQNSALPQSDRPEAIAAVDGGFTVITLDTKAARNNLEKAKQDLASNDMGDADLALAQVQQSVDLESAGSNLPLVRARENLGLADSAVQAKNYTEAQASLNAAASALENYGQTSGQHASAAKQLSQQIKSASQNLETNKSSADTKISNWWKEVSNWTQASS